MKKVVLSVVLAAGLASTTALAADMPMKAPPPPPAAPTPTWDVAFGTALMTDYNFRGITQSDHRPSVAGYFEPRYNINSNLQLYAGMSGESIEFPNRAAAEVDFYGGIRPTFDKLALDAGFWYYYYPDGTCYNSAVAGCQPSLINGNVIKADLSFWEVYGKATYTFNDNFSAGISTYYSPSVLNSGASGWYTSGNVKFTAPSAWFATGWGGYASGDLGYWKLGTSDSFYGVTGFPGGIPYTSYWNWDAGIGLTYKVFTLDLRYYGTNLNSGDCNAFTSDHTASGVSSTPINPGGPASNWCGAAYIAKFSVDTTLNAIK
jgi:uncharacterized protein (TIGR02001 family)